MARGSEFKPPIIHHTVAQYNSKIDLPQKWNQQIGNPTTNFPKLSPYHTKPCKTWYQVHWYQFRKTEDIYIYNIISYFCLYDYTNQDVPSETPEVLPCVSYDKDGVDTTLHNDSFIHRIDVFSFIDVNQVHVSQPPMDENTIHIFPYYIQDISPNDPGLVGLKLFGSWDSSDIIFMLESFLWTMEPMLTL